MVAIYYFHAGLYLIDPAVLDVSPATGIALSVAGLVLGWIVYDGLCRSPLGRNEAVLATIGFLFLTALAWLSTRLFSPRGAFMQMGALIGTIMAANVLMVIIPGQRKVVADLIAGRTPDPVHGRRGKQRSTHNNYLTLPVVFVMLSGHYPLAYATRWCSGDLAPLLVTGGNPPLLNLSPGRRAPVDLGGCVRIGDCVAIDAGPADARAPAASAGRTGTRRAPPPVGRRSS